MPLGKIYNIKIINKTNKKKQGYRHMTVQVRKSIGIQEHRYRRREQSRRGIDNVDGVSYNSKKYEGKVTKDSGADNPNAGIVDAADEANNKIDKICENSNNEQGTSHKRPRGVEKTSHRRPKVAQRTNHRKPREA